MTDDEKLIEEAAERAYPDTEWSQTATMLAFRDAFARGWREAEKAHTPSADWDRVHDRPADIYTPPEDRIVRPSPQGEPSDAQVDAAIRGFHEATFGTSDDSFLTPERLANMRDPWRAALRAAGGAR